MSQRKTTPHTVIHVTDDVLSYVTLDRNAHGFFIVDHEYIELPKETIVRGEILKADLLGQILKKMRANIPNATIDVLLPHEYFLCDMANLKKTSSRVSLKKRVLAHLKDSHLPWRTTHVCEFRTHTTGDKDTIVFVCLPAEVQKSYTHVLERSGFVVRSISSDILAFGHLVGTERTSLVVVGRDAIRIAEFKDGVYVSHKTFQASYNQCIESIKSVLKISHDDAQRIFDKYGLLRAHKDEHVYRRLVRSMSPVVDFMSQRKIKGASQVRVVFLDTPILGFIDWLVKTLNVHVTELDVLKTNIFTFQDVLTLHRDESYQYQSLIAQALARYKK